MEVIDEQGRLSGVVTIFAALPSMTVDDSRTAIANSLAYALFVALLSPPEQAAE